jgi:hypothetical protein
VYLIGALLIAMIAYHFVFFVAFLMFRLVLILALAAVIFGLIRLLDMAWRKH